MKKNYTIVYMRVVATLLIVVYHSICFHAGIWPIFNPNKNHFFNAIAIIMNDIHLPIFVFISGMLFYWECEKGKYIENRTFIAKKFSRLLVPYFFWGIVMLLLMPTLYQPLEMLTGIGHLWFLMMLFFVFLLMIFVNSIWCKLFLQHKILIIFALFVLSRFVWNLGLNISWKKDYLTYLMVLTYIPFFLWGMTVAQFQIYNVLKEKKTWQIALLTLLFFVIIVIDLINPPFKVLFYCVPISLFLLSLYSVIDSKLGGKKPGSMVSSIDRNSMGIYIIHHIVIWLIIAAWGGQFLEYPYLGSLFLFVFSFFVSYIASSLLLRSKVLSFIIGG